MLFLTVQYHCLAWPSLQCTKIGRSITFWSEFSAPSAEVSASEVSGSFYISRGGKPRGQAPMRSHATWLQKHCLWPSQIHFPALWNHWLSHGHCDGKMPVMMGTGLCTQAGYEKKLASNSQFKLWDCTKMQRMLQEYSHSRDSTSI